MLLDTRLIEFNRLSQNWMPPHFGKQVWHNSAHLLDCDYCSDRRMCFCLGIFKNLFWDFSDDFCVRTRKLLETLSGRLSFFPRNVHTSTYTIHRMIFSIWRHSIEQVYFGYNQNKSQHCVRISCLSIRVGEGE